MAIHPSDLLAQIAAAIFLLERSRAVPNDTLEEWLTRATDDLSHEPPPTIPEWELNEPDLASTTHSMAPMRIIESATNYAEFLAQVTILQFLDRWHFPLSGIGSSSGARKTQLHEASADNLAYKRFYGRSEAGRIIPALLDYDAPREIQEVNELIVSREHANDPPKRGDEISQRPNILRPLLENTIFLPWMLEAPHVDSPNIASSRQIKIEYTTPSTRRTMPSRGADERLKIAVAPLAQSKSDVTFEITTDGSNYAVKPSYPKDRIRKVLTNAINNDIEYLYFPESTVPEEDISDLKKTVRLEVKAYAERRGSLPAFRGLFAGVSGTENDKGSN